MMRRFSAGERALGLPRLYKASFASVRIPPHIGLSARGEPDAFFQVSLLNPLENPKPAWSFKTELLKEGDQQIVSRGIRGRKEHLSPTAGLSALKLVELSDDSSAARLLRKLQDFTIYCPNTPTLRGSTPDAQTRTPVGLAGGSLAEGFESVKKSVSATTLDEVLDLMEWVSENRGGSNGPPRISFLQPSLGVSRS